MAEGEASIIAVGGALIVFLVVRALVRVWVVRTMARRLSEKRDQTP